MAPPPSAEDDGPSGDSFRFAADRTKVGDLVNRLIRVGVGHGGSSFAVVPLDVYRCEDASPAGVEKVVSRREAVRPKLVCIGGIVTAPLMC